MKPKEYVRKFKLDQQDRFNRSLFIEDFIKDLRVSIEYYTNNKQMNVGIYERLVSELKNKWDSIFIRSKLTIEQYEAFWKYFYATIIIPIRNNYFGENEEIYEERFNHFREDFSNFFKSIFSGPQIEKYKLILDINSEDLSRDVVNEQYRKLSLIHHPDRGGNLITEAKEYLLEHLNV
jgi:hypothetical protein